MTRAGRVQAVAVVVEAALAAGLAATLAAGLAAVVGCGGDQPREAAPPGRDEPIVRAEALRADTTRAREARAREVVATVDGEPIYGAEIEPPGPPRDQPSLAVARERYLENAITRRLMRREAARLGLTAADEPALFAALRAQEVDDKVVVTEADLQAEFVANSRRYPRFPRVHLRQIAIPLAPDATPAQVEAESRRLRDRTAGELGKAPIGEVGVDLGPLEYQLGDEPMGEGILADPALRTVAASLTPGAVSPVVRSSSGVHILLCVAKDADGPPTFASTRRRVQAVVQARARAHAEEAWLSSLRARHRVEKP